MTQETSVIFGHPHTNYREMREMLTYIATTVPIGPSDNIFFTGTVIAGLVAALASLLGLVISKETKVSEFRQKWLDSKRCCTHL